LYGHNVPWWPTREFEKQHIQPEQSARYEADVWEDRIATFLRTATRVTVGDVATGALGFDTNRVGTADARRIAAVMINLRWKREREDGKTDWQGKRCWIKA
jgi:predicted P-loop ATPase